MAQRTVKAHRRGKSQVRPYVRGGHGPGGVKNKKNRVTLPTMPPAPDASMSDIASGMGGMAPNQPMGNEMM